MVLKRGFLLAKAGQGLDSLSVSAMVERTGTKHHDQRGCPFARRTRELLKRCTGCTNGDGKAAVPSLSRVSIHYPNCV